MGTQQQETNQKTNPIDETRTQKTHAKIVEIALNQKDTDLGPLRACFEQQPKVDPNTTIQGQRLLHHTIFHNKLGQFEIVHAAGADVNLANADGDSPLHFACQLGRYLFIKKLMSCKNIQLLKRNKKGLIPYDILLTRPKPKSPDVIRIRDNLRDLTILTAAKFNDVETIKKHVNKKNCDKKINSKWQFLLNVAAKNGDYEIAKYLLECGASTQVVDKRGNSPLHLAVEYNESNLVRLLLDYKANPEAENEDDYSVIQLALPSYAKYKESENLPNKNDFHYNDCKDIIKQAVVRRNPSALMITPDELRRDLQVIYQINSETKVIYLFSSLPANDLDPFKISAEIFEFCKLCLQRALQVKAKLKIVYVARLNEKFTNYVCTTDGEILIVNSLVGYKSYDEAAMNSLVIAIKESGLQEKKPIFTFVKGSTLRDISNANVLTIEATRELYSSENLDKLNDQIKGIFNKAKKSAVLPQLYIKNNISLRSFKYLDTLIQEYLKLSESNVHIKPAKAEAPAKLSPQHPGGELLPARKIEKRKKGKEKKDDRQVRFRSDSKLLTVHEYPKYITCNLSQKSPDDIARDIYHEFLEKNHLSVADIKSKLSNETNDDMDAIVNAANRIKNHKRSAPKKIFGCCHLTMPRFFYNKPVRERLTKTEQKAWSALKKTYFSLLITQNETRMQEQVEELSHRKFINFHRRNWRILTFGKTNSRKIINRLLKQKSKTLSLHS